MLRAVHLNSTKGLIAVFEKFRFPLERRNLAYLATLLRLEYPFAIWTSDAGTRQTRYQRSPQFRVTNYQSCGGLTLADAGKLLKKKRLFR
jgi:hypothetical protein